MPKIAPFCAVTQFMALATCIETSSISSKPLIIKEILDEQVLLRLAGVAIDKTVRATIDLTISREGRRELRLLGHFTGDILLSCQRCLEPFLQPLEAKIDNIIVEPVNVEELGRRAIKWSEDDARDDDEYLDVEGRIALLQLIEDELLLAVPVFPKHGTHTDCSKDVLAQLQTSTELQDKRKNPFEILKQLK